MMENNLFSSARCFIIAEIGSNHNGDLDCALRLMDIAQKADADAVKFQSFLADHLVTKENPDYELLKRIELPKKWYPILKEEAEARDLVFFSTATNEITLGWMKEIQVEMYKLASPNITHLPLIRKTASIGKPVIMSTGMAGLFEIDEAVRTFTSTGNRMLSLLHCVSEYPAHPEHINLRFIPTLQTFYPFPVGFSDHTLNIGTSIAAVALGAKIIEKHITLDRNSEGPDHHYALEPNEFISMVKNIRIVEHALGSSMKTISDLEKDKALQYWRSIHASRDLETGTVIKAEFLSFVRPNDGLHPRHIDEITGLELKKPLKKGQPVTWDAFK